MKKILTYFFVLILLIQFGAIGFLFWQNNEMSSKVNEYEQSKLEKLNFIANVNKDPEVLDIEEIRQVSKQPKDISEVYQTGWIPDWDYDDGFETIKTRTSDFNGVSPFWFEINEDGSLKQVGKTNDSEFIDFVKENNVDFIPTITCFDAAKLSKVLNSEENMRNHINSIVNMVSQNNYDGIDLDYESTYFDDKEKFFEFLQGLSLALNNIDKRLVFTVLPKWSDDTVYTGFPETRAVQDYKQISDLVDEFRIMTYEYSGRTNKYFGPNAPLAWMEDTLRYAIWSGVPREKIVLGVPTYSYDYSERDILPQIKYLPILRHEFVEESEGAFAYYNNQVDKIIDDYETEIEFNEEWGEGILRYVFEGQNRIVVYPTSESIRLRKQLAADYGIKGVAIWRIGDEGRLEY